MTNEQQKCFRDYLLRQIGRFEEKKNSEEDAFIKYRADGALSAFETVLSLFDMYESMND